MHFPYLESSNFNVKKCVHPSKKPSDIHVATLDLEKFSCSLMCTKPGMQGLSNPVGVQIIFMMNFEKMLAKWSDRTLLSKFEPLFKYPGSSHGHNQYMLMMSVCGRSSLHHKGAVSKRLTESSNPFIEALLMSTHNISFYIEVPLKSTHVFVET